MVDIMCDDPGSAESWLPDLSLIAGDETPEELIAALAVVFGVSPGPRLRAALLARIARGRASGPNREST
jgi:hypothetical protein